MTSTHDQGETAESPEIDTSTPNVSRRYDYWAGGKDNFQADRNSADTIEHAYPYIRAAVAQNLAARRRAVRYLAEDAGITQFLDIGVGFPAPGSNTHEIAQQINPSARVVYVDNNRQVMTHARALLTCAPPGRCAHAQADLRHPAGILTNPNVTATIDFARPVAILLFAVLHFVPDSDDPAGIVHTLLDAAAPGSYLAATHATSDPLDATTIKLLTTLTENEPFTLRSREQISGFFTGLDLVEPGIEILNKWRPDKNTDDAPPNEVAMFCGVGRKPGGEAR